MRLELKSLKEMELYDFSQILISILFQFIILRERC